MRKIIITITAICGLSFASYYDVGDSWKLADWNGATNGGHYTVIFIEMSATW